MGRHYVHRDTPPPSLTHMQLAMKAVPYHVDFLKYLGSDGTAGGDDQVIQDMAQFADSLEVIVTIINLFYQQHNLDL